MSNRLESYLEDLRGRLVRHFEPKRLDEVIAEMRSHVTYSARDAQAELGMEADEAMRSALAALGPVETVAEDLVHQHRGGTTKSEWQVVKVPLILYVISSFVLPTLFLVFGLFPVYQFTIPGKLMAYMPTVVLLTFMIAIWRSRRWLVKPMVLGILGCYVAASALPLIPGYAETVSKQFGVDPNYQQKRLAQIDQELRMVELGAKGYLESRDAFQAPDSSARLGSQRYFFPERIANTWMVPVGLLPFHMPIPSTPIVRLNDDVWNPKHADKWTQHGAAYREEWLWKERSELLAGRLEGFYPGWRMGLYIYGSQVATLALANVAVLAASNRRRRRRARRDPHLA